MNFYYWIIRDDIDNRVHVRFLDSRYQNMNAFLFMACEDSLREAVETLREAPEAPYRTCPGEFLELRAEHGMAEAEIDIFGDQAIVRLPVEIFCRVVTEYLNEVDRMYRERSRR